MSIFTVMRKEIQESLRNRWVLANTLLLAALALTLTFLGSAPVGNVGASRLDVVIVSLASLTTFLVPLIALLISHDAIVGEMERGTMLLLLSYPLSRRRLILGKFLGHIAILAFATLAGYGAAGLALAATGTEIDAASWRAFAGMVFSSILLGAVFVAIGYLVSALVRQRSTAAGIAIGIWLVFVLIYDMALLGALVADQGRFIGMEVLNLALLLNPTDAYRLLNLGSGGAGSLAGMTGLAETASIGPGLLLGALALWVVVPLAAATLVFSRKEL